MKILVVACASVFLFAGCAPPGPCGYEVFNRSARAVASIQTRSCDGGPRTPMPASTVGAGQRFVIPTATTSPCVDLQALDGRGVVLAEQLHVTLSAGSIWTFE
jgi:hypothetical protein